MGHVHRFVRLSAAQDAALRAVEQNGDGSRKARLRASVVRLSNAGMSVSQLAAHFARSPQGIRADLRRYEQHGLEGLRDGKSPGAPPIFTPEMRAHVAVLLQQDRVWNCALLQDAMAEHFGVGVGREAMRGVVKGLGYAWKRTKYVPTKTPHPDVVFDHQASLDTLKRGQGTAN